MYSVYCESTEFTSYCLMLRPNILTWFGVMDVYKESTNNDKCNEGGPPVHDKHHSYTK